MNVNLTTFLNQLGYGQVGLNLLKAFARAGHEVALWVNGPGEAPAEDRPLIDEAQQRTARYDPEALSLRVAHQWDMAHRVGRGRHAGLTFFELDELTAAEVHHLSNLDVVLSPTAWGAAVMVACGVPAEKVGYAPLGVDRDVFHPGVAPFNPDGLADRLRQRNTTVFLSCGKWEVRKGHDVLIDAYCRAFKPGDNVLLVLNCHNPFLGKEGNKEWSDLYQNSPMGRHVLVVPERLRRQQEVAGLMALADCGVFPARAEGWNLEALECLAMGKEVIATNYAGHTEFLTDDNARLIDVPDREEAFDGHFFPGGRGRWAAFGELQIEQLAAHMHRVHQQKQGGGLEVNEDGLRTAGRFSWDNTVSEIVSSL